MKRLLLIGSLLSTPAYAIDYCKISPDDDQVRLCPYSALQRYAVNAPVGFPVNLKFGDGEQIKRHEFAYTGITKVDDKGNVAPSATWTGPERGRSDKALDKGLYVTNFPIWPFQEGHAALIVITQTQDGRERSYQFDLTATTAANKNTTSELIFTYQADVDEAARKAAAEKKEQAAAAWRAQQAKSKEAEGIARLKVDAFYGERNWAYRAKGEKKYQFLAPSEVSDNGWLTEFQWPGNLQAPTITVIDPVTGEPQIMPVSKQGDMYIVGQTAKQFRLFLGHDPVMDIYNLHWSPERPDPKTGTTSPEVVRTVTYLDRK